MGLVVDGDGGRAGGSHCVQNSEGRRSGGDTRESVGLGLGWVGLDWVGLGWIGLDWVGLDGKKMLKMYRPWILIEGT